jgi:hypothetical protein
MARRAAIDRRRAPSSYWAIAYLLFMVLWQVR